MENEYINNIAQEQTQQYSHEKIQKILHIVDESSDKIERLQKRRGGEYERSIKKVELNKILRVLPKEVNVLYYGKDLCASRVKKEDKIVKIWWKEDLNKYLEILEEIYTAKALDFDFPRKWK